LLCYPGLVLYFTPLARPDGLGTLVFLAAIATPWLFNFSYGSIVVSAVLSIAGFVVKPYFLLAEAIVFSYLLLFVSLPKASLFIGICSVLQVIGYLLIGRFFPTYFYDVIFVQTGLVAKFPYSFSYARQQAVEFLRSYWSLCALLLVSAAVLAGKHLSNIKQFARREGLRAIRLPLPFKMDLFLFAAVVGAAACIYPLGGSLGTFMTYFFQLITPCLAVAVVGLVADHAAEPAWKSAVVRVVAIALMTVNMASLVSWASPRIAWSTTLQEWSALETFLRGYRNVLHTPPLVALLMSQGKPVYDSGFTQYFRAGVAPHSAVSGNVALRIRAWRMKMAGNLRGQKYDLVATTDNPNGVDGMPAFSSRRLLHRYYKYCGSHEILLAVGQRVRLNFWLPRRDESPDTLKPDRASSSTLAGCA